MAALFFFVLSTTESASRVRSSFIPKKLSLKMSDPPLIRRSLSALLRASAVLIAASAASSSAFVLSIFAFIASSDNSRDSLWRPSVSMKSLAALLLPSAFLCLVSASRVFGCMKSLKIGNSAFLSESLISEPNLSPIYPIILLINSTASSLDFERPGVKLSSDTAFSLLS